VKGKFIFTDYFEEAMGLAVYEEMEDGTLAGHIPPCEGLFAFGATELECQEELRATLEDWTLVGIRHGHDLPVIAGIDLNLSLEPVCEPVESL
jgi:predicted RNase H-like HicB family nuclease